MALIFIIYQRTHAGGPAGRLLDHLRHWFLDGIDTGESFPTRILAMNGKYPPASATSERRRTTH
jgi:hypothetical protein